MADLRRSRRRASGASSSTPRRRAAGETRRGVGALLAKAAPELMAQSARRRTRSRLLHASLSSTITPHAHEEQGVQDKRLEVSKTASRSASRRVPWRTLLEGRGGSSDRREQSGLRLRDRQGGAARSERDVAIRVFQKGLEGRKPGDAVCADEYLRLSVLGARALSARDDNAKVGRAVAASACFYKLRPASRGELRTARRGTTRRTLLRVEGEERL